MTQLSTCFAAVGAAFSLLCMACTSSPPCPELVGRWTNREGQDLVFQPDGRALWLTRFGSQFDTVRMGYQLGCGQAPATLDLTGFQSGPYQGKTLFGIVEWQSDSSFRLRYEPGIQAAARPKAFDLDQTLKFFRMQ